MNRGPSTKNSSFKDPSHRLVNQFENQGRHDRVHGLTGMESKMFLAVHGEIMVSIDVS
jgi:hypothetical protein